MTDTEKVRLRERLVMGILTDGKAKSFDEAIEKAERVYKWIMEGPKS